jgi:hypothetical protein
LNSFLHDLSLRPCDVWPEDMVVLDPET